MKVWSADTNTFFQVEDSSLERVLPNHVFKLMFSQQTGFFLERISEQFHFSHKIYGTERPFIDHVLRTWANTKSNLGLLLNGIKGTGKSVTAKILANEVGIPVILVEANQGKGMIDYLAGIQQDVIVFIDEYEKVFKTSRSRSDDEPEQDATMLTLMDGVMKTDFRKLFLLTTNEVRIHDAMQQRPGRLRYIKTFGNLTKDVIIEIVDDMLERTDLRSATIEFIARLEIITVDIVSSVVSEVNIHGVDPEEFAHIFNVKKLQEKFDVYYKTDAEDAKEEVLKYSAIVGHLNDEGRFNEYSTVYVAGTDIGEIDEVGEGSIYRMEVSRYGAMMMKGTKHGENVSIRIEPVPSYHSSFAGANAF